MVKLDGIESVDHKFVWWKADRDLWISISEVQTSIWGGCWEVHVHYSFFPCSIFTANCLCVYLQRIANVCAEEQGRIIICFFFVIIVCGVTLLGSKFEVDTNLTLRFISFAWWTLSSRKLSNSLDQHNFVYKYEIIYKFAWTAKCKRFVVRLVKIMFWHSMFWVQFHSSLYIEKGKNNFLLNILSINYTLLFFFSLKKIYTHTWIKWDKIMEIKLHDVTFDRITLWS